MIRRLCDWLARRRWRRRAIRHWARWFYVQGYSWQTARTMARSQIDHRTGGLE